MDEKAEFEALICERNSLLIMLAAMEAENYTRMIGTESLCYGESSFLELYDRMQKLADRFRQLKGDKN